MISSSHWRSPGHDAHTGAVTFERITIDSGRMNGLPCRRDLRLPVTTVVGLGRTYEEVLADFPDLEAEDIYAALRVAAAASCGTSRRIDDGLRARSTAAARGRNHAA